MRRALTYLAAVIALAAGLLTLGGCEEYPQDTPDAVIDSARKMLEDGKAEKLRRLLYSENPKLNGVLDRVGAMLGHVQDLSTAVNGAFPEEVAKLRAQAEEAAREGKASSLIGSAIMRGTGGGGAARRRQPQRSEQDMRDLFDRTVKEVFADPYGWLARSEGRLSTTILADDMAAVLWDGKPILPPLGIVMKQVGSKWYVLLPTNIPGISSVVPSSEEGWTILEKLIVALDRAMIDLSKDVRSGKVRSLREVSEKAGEKAFIPAVIVMIAYGRLMEIREDERRANAAPERQRPGLAPPAAASPPEPGG